jgi:hypothetical protein
MGVFSATLSLAYGSPEPLGRLVRSCLRLRDFCSEPQGARACSLFQALRHLLIGLPPERLFRTWTIVTGFHAKLNDRPTQNITFGKETHRPACAYPLRNILLRCQSATSSFLIRLEAFIGGEPNILYGFVAGFRKSRAFASRLGPSPIDLILFSLSGRATFRSPFP